MALEILDKLGEQLSTGDTVEVWEADTENGGMKRTFGNGHEDKDNV